MGDVSNFIDSFFRLSQQLPLQPTAHVRALRQQEHDHLVIYSGVADHVGVVSIDILNGIKYRLHKNTLTFCQFLTSIILYPRRRRLTSGQCKRDDGSRHRPLLIPSDVYSFLSTVSASGAFFRTLATPFSQAERKV